jgi:hypothetical protein
MVLVVNGRVAAMWLVVRCIGPKACPSEPIRERAHPSTSRKPTTNTMPNMSVSASPDWSQNSGDMMRVAHKATGQSECRRSKT